LDQPAWAGIRQRKVNLERLLREAIDKVLDKVLDHTSWMSRPAKVGMSR
jgi:hypothetical protein